MRIHRLRLANYRGVVESEVVFPASGVTVVQGPNEAGKSSLAEALDLLLDHYDDTQKAAVRAVKPVHRDAGAEVEAELSAGPYRFTYAKRFHKDRATTLTVHEPTPLSKTGREAHDAVRTMLAETVDLALWQAQRLTQGAAVEQADLREQAALARALDRAAGGPAARDREATLYEQVVAEYRRYHTATGRPSIEVKDAVAAHESACDAAELARKQLAEIEADVEHCTALERELVACRGRIAEHRERLPALERAQAELSSRRDQVERVRLSAELADSALAAAQADLDARLSVVNEVASAGDAVAWLRDEQDRAAPAAAVAEIAHEQSEREVADRRAALRAARDAAARMHAAYERQRDRLDLELLAERAERVAAAQRQAAQADAVLETARLDDRTLAAIDQAHLDVLAAAARLEGDHAVVEVRALGSAVVEAGGRRVPAHGEATVPVTASVEVTVPGVVAVRVRPGSGITALAAAHDDAVERLSACLAAAGVADVADARRAHQRRADAERARSDAREALRRDLRDLTPELLADKVRRLRERVGDEEVPADLDAARQAVERADATVSSCADELAAAEEVLGRAAAERESARHTRTELAARLEGAQATLDDRRAVLAAARASVPDDELEGRVAAATDAAAAAGGAHAEAARALEAADPESVHAALANVRAAAERDAAELRRLERDLLQTRTRLQLRGEEGLADRLAEAESQVAHTGQRREAVQARAAAARLLHETMTCRRDEARQAYVAPFRDKITALGRIVFGPDLSVELDEDLVITSRTLAGVTVPFADLSAGAREQLAVIARLACAAITSDDGGVPLILDDALGHSDPARLEALGAVFSLAAREAQVIVLTCVPDRYRHIGAAHVVRV